MALDLMMEEFGSGVPNTRVMAVDLTLAEALELKEEIARVPGVTDVMWLDDVEDITTPVELMDEATVSQYWEGRQGPLLRHHRERPRGRGDGRHL